MTDRVVLDHGSGGLLSRELVDRVIVPALGDAYLGRMEDSAVLALPPGRIAMTTDSFVVDPLFFGGGDIGKLAVCGTVNDLAMSGAQPLYLTLAMILEVGFPLEDLRTICASVAATAREAGVHVVAGDTKVVDRGAADKVFLNTAGVGVFSDGRVELSTRHIEDGDAVIVTSPVGNHTIHLLSLREGLGYETRVTSDCAPLNGLVGELASKLGDRLHCMRDLTRGGLGTALAEIASDTAVGIEVDGDAVPIQPETQMAADMLGVDPIFLANEGSCVAFVAGDALDDALHVLQQHPYGTGAREIGRVTTEHPAEVLATTAGVVRTIEPLVGAQLPRLC